MDETDARRRNHWFNHIARHAHAEFAVIGTPHERWGETPVAVAAPLPDASLTLDELGE